MTGANANAIRAMGPFLISTFLSALLLFQVQPIIARFILPAYGGSASLWTACMMFFQAALLLGYLYAHLLSTRVSQRQQPVLHLVLLGLSLVFLPIGPPDSWIPAADGNPAIEIPLLLALSVGVPFVLIAASGPLLQHWYAGVFPGRSPFRLYALSNLGSLAGLLSYPFLVEPALTLSAQTRGWSLAYVVLAALLTACAYPYRNQGKELAAAGSTHVPAEQPATLADRLMWISLAACGSTVLLAVTNQICQDVAVFPFLWILPLALYLVSFIITFERDAWYLRLFWWPVLVIALGFTVDLMFEEFSTDESTLLYQVAVYSSLLFSCCMVCHGELARARSAVAELTTFYLYVALGGALGGIFVNLVAPLVFTGFWELHLGMVGTALLAGVCLARENQWLRTGLRRPVFALGWAVLVVAFAALMVKQVSMGREHSIYVTRGFFGVLYVDEEDVGYANHKRQFYHGKIRHGQQMMEPALQRTATTYYNMATGVAKALTHHPNRDASRSEDRGLRIGAVGMGVATLSAYAQPYDSMRYYEINPQVVDIAQEYFYFLENDRAETEIVLGDARLSMQKELQESGSNRFDVLVLDAFSGDGIPVHLMTEEAFALYLQHLEPDGIIAIHITNKYIDLSPVVLDTADRFGLTAVLVETEGRRWYEDYADWALLSKNSAFLESPVLTRDATPWYEPDERVHWTDNFSNLIELVGWNY